jgi:DNA-binding HxlR family transcriptional regulator
MAAAETQATTKPQAAKPEAAKPEAAKTRGPATPEAAQISAAAETRAAKTRAAAQTRTPAETRAAEAPVVAETRPAAEIQDEVEARETGAAQAEAEARETGAAQADAEARETAESEAEWEDRAADYYDVFASTCPSRPVLEHVTGRWGSLTLGALANGPRRFNDLRRRVDGVSQKILAQTLQTLERDGFVKRTVHSTFPLHVEYSLTPMGQSLADRLLDFFGHLQGQMPEVERAQHEYDRRPQ